MGGITATGTVAAVEEWMTALTLGTPMMLIIGLIALLGIASWVIYVVTAVRRARSAKRKK